jgi:WD40 repeat protein
VRREAVACSLLLAIASTLTAAESARLDRFGDPLPDGAIFRLGTTRFRPATSYCQFALAPDGKVFATGDSGDVRLWDAETGKPRWSSRLPGEMKCDRLLFSPDGQELMAIAWEWGRGTHLYTGFRFATSSGNPLKNIAPPKTALGTGHWQFLADGAQLLTAEEFVPPGLKENQPKFGNALLYGPPDPVVPVVWNLQTGKEIWRLPAAMATAASPDAKAIATTMGDSITLWDVLARKSTAEFRSADAEFKSLTWSADSKTLAAIRHTSPKMEKTSSRQAKDRIELVCWDVVAKKDLLVWATDPESFAISRDGKHVAAIDRNSRLEVREVRTGKALLGTWAFDNQIMALVPKTHTWCRGHMVFMPDGSLLIHDLYHEFRRFDVATGQRLKCSTGAHGREGFDLTPDGKTIIRPESVFGGPPIVFRDVASGIDRASLGQHAARIRQLIIAKREPILLSQDDEGSLKVWDLTEGTSLPTPVLGSIAPNGFGFLDEGRTVVAIGKDAVARVWEARTGRIVREFRLADFPIWRNWKYVEKSYAHQKDRDWLSLSADKRTVAIAGTDRSAVWDVTSGKRIGVLKEPAERIDKIELAADGASIAITTAEALIVRTADGKQRLRLDRHLVRNNFQTENRLIPSADGKCFAHVAEELTVYEVATGKKRSSIAVVDGSHSAIAFTPDNKSLVVASHQDKLVALYDVDNGKQIASLDPSDRWNELWQQVNDLPPNVGVWPDWSRMGFRLHAAIINQTPPQYQSSGRYVCSRDNRLIACAKEENVTLFEIRTGKKIASFESSPKGEINCVLFASDNRRLITGSSNSTIHVWDWIAAAKLQPDPHVRPDAAAWNELANDDPHKAYRTINMLAQHPREALQLLREHLKPVTRREAEEVRDWIGALNDPRFSVRDQARKGLALRGEDALPQLLMAAKQPISPEVATSVSGLIARWRESRRHTPGARHSGPGVAESNRIASIPPRPGRGRTERSAHPRSGQGVATAVSCG